MTEQVQEKNTSQDIEITVNDEYFADSDYLLKKYYHSNIKGHQIGQNWVAVFMEDGNTKLYPASRVNEITVIVKE